MVLASLLLTGWILPAQPQRRPDSPFLDIRPTPWNLVVPEAGAAAPARHHIPRPSRLAGTALVEVWGEAPWNLTERLRLMRMELAPDLARAYAAGSSLSADVLALNEFLMFWSEPRFPQGGAICPTVPAFYYNTLRPVEESEGFRLEFRGRSNLLTARGERQ